MCINMIQEASTGPKKDGKFMSQYIGNIIYCLWYDIIFCISYGAYLKYGLYTDDYVLQRLT